MIVGSSFLGFQRSAWVALGLLYVGLGEALYFIVRAKELGFTLGQIREVLTIRRTGQKPCGCVKEIIERNLQDIDRRMKALSAMRGELKALAARTTSAEMTVPICPIIDARPVGRRTSSSQGFKAAAAS